MSYLENVASITTVMPPVKNKVECLNMGLKCNPAALRYIDRELIETYPVLAETAVGLDPDVIRFLPAIYHHKHPDLIQVAVDQNPMVLKYTDKIFQLAHPGILKVAVEHCPEVVQCLHSEARLLMDSKKNSQSVGSPKVL